MERRKASRLAAGIYGLEVAAAIAAGTLQLITRNAAISSSFAYRGIDVALVVVIGSMGYLIATRRPDNTIGWLLLAAGACGSFTYFAQEYATLSYVEHAGTLPFTRPFSWLQNWLWVPTVSIIGIYCLALFPDGKALSRGWGRFLTFFVPSAVALFSLGIALAPGQLQTAPAGVNNPYTSKAIGDVLGAVGGILFIVSIVGGVTALVKRFRRSKGEAREQLKWLVLASSLVGLSFAVSLPIFYGLGNVTGNRPETPLLKVVEVFVILSILSVPVATAVAILRHRLYDIDVVINKAVVFAALAAGITLVYVGVVVGIGAAVGSRGRPNVGLSVAATALVALAFQPLRAWARRVANRLVYGKRATPHDVLTVLGERISEAYSLEEVLPRLARLVTEATAASAAEVWLRVGGEMRPTAAYPDDPPAGTTVPAPDENLAPEIPGAQRTFPVRHQGELLGAVAVRTPANEQLTSADERLLTDLSSHAGLVLRNLRLIEELRASRQRLVSAQDIERRKIERNLHDGAQQHLVALSINLGLARSLVDGDPAQVREILDQLKTDAAEALETLRDLARGIYPPLLADRGLAAALTSHATKAPVPTKVEAGEVNRYPMEVEAAVYFCVLEALQNVAKYAGAANVIVRLAEDDGSLVFAVTDDGAGFDVARAARGAGLTNMTDRLEALGGRLEVTSRPGAGTTIRGWVSSAPPPATS